MNIYKRGKYWHIRYRLNGVHYSESSRSTDRAGAQELLRLRLEEAGRKPAVENIGPGVYFLFSPATGFIKIGSTELLPQRLSTLATSSGESMALIAHIRTGRHRTIERHIHRKFKAQRVKGEWFDLSKIDLAKAIHLTWILSVARRTKTRTFMGESALPCGTAITANTSDGLLNV